jgi:IS1 family transposase
MNKLSTDERTKIIAALVEGNSIRATCRLTGTAKGTVIKLLRDIGKACCNYQDQNLRNLKLNYVQCDEIWSFCYAKAKNVPDQYRGQRGYGDIWTFTAIDSDTKLIPCWLVGQRDIDSAREFIYDLSQRLANRIQLTTDGHKIYAIAVEDVFGADIDYAILVKLYGQPEVHDTRYSPPACISATPQRMNGFPDLEKASTSFVERQNLTMRMSMRRFTRLTNAFSKKLENLEYAVALHFMYYNFARVHKTLKQTPAMAAGIADHVWTIQEIIGLLNDKNFSE